MTKYKIITATSEGEFEKALNGFMSELDTFKGEVLSVQFSTAVGVDRVRKESANGVSRDEYETTVIFSALVNYKNETPR